NRGVLWVAHVRVRGPSKRMLSSVAPANVAVSTLAQQRNAYDLLCSSAVFVGSKPLTERRTSRTVVVVAVRAGLEGCRQLGAVVRNLAWRIGRDVEVGPTGPAVVIPVVH